MYAVRVLIDGRIYIVRTSDKVWASYNADGTPSYGCTNKLKLDPNNVIQMAKEAEAEWFKNHLGR